MARAELLALQYSLPSQHVVDRFLEVGHGLGVLLGPLPPALVRRGEEDERGEQDEAEEQRAAGKGGEAGADDEGQEGREHGDRHRVGLHGRRRTLELLACERSEDPGCGVEADGESGRGCALVQPAHDQFRVPDGEGLTGVDPGRPDEGAAAEHHPVGAGRVGDHDRVRHPQHGVAPGHGRIANDDIGAHSVSADPALPRTQRVHAALLGTGQGGEGGDGGDGPRSAAGHGLGDDGDHVAVVDVGREQTLGPTQRSAGRRQRAHGRTGHL